MKMTVGCVREFSRTAVESFIYGIAARVMGNLSGDPIPDALLPTQQTLVVIVTNDKHLHWHVTASCMIAVHAGILGIARKSRTYLLRKASGFTGDQVLHLSSLCEGPVSNNAIRT